MDLDACLKILAQRGQTTNNSSNPSEIAKACPCCAELVTKEPKSYDNGISDHNNDNDALGKLPTLELVQLFTTLQGERVSTYSSFDISLNRLLEEGGIAEYPMLCAEFTSRFSILSSTCIKIKEILNDRSQKGIADFISEIQSLEKEKLILIAAKHMETIQVRIPALQQHMGSEITLQPEYIASKIAMIEGKINEILESVTCAKCSLLDAE